MPKIDKSSEQKVAGAAVESFHDDLGPFVVAAETTRMVMVFSDACDPDNPIIFANDSLVELTGYSRGRTFNLQQNVPYFFISPDTTKFHLAC